MNRSHTFQQRVNPAPKARQRCNEKCQRRAKEQNRKRHNAKMRKGGRR